MAKEFYMSKSAPIVETPKGKIRGFHYDGVDHFYGIRYAKAKRFQMPEPVKAWEGVKDAGSYGMICPVLNEPQPMGEVTIPHRFWPSSEHCQYLNVWTTKCDPEAKKPVLFWMHGGGFSAGSSIEQVAYDGFNLAKLDDVVVVTVNHRLNVFGYLDLSAYGEKYKNSVNVGMADLVEALRWVRDNIACFGGDPDNVTIFGQSGGGAKVTVLGQIPEADGLFHKAIVMSGVMGGGGFGGKPCEHKDFVLELLKVLNLEEKDVEKLEKVPVPQFITFYNGTDDQPERKLLHLSDLYDDAGKKMIRENAEKMQLVSGLELDVLVININKGYSEDLKKGCRLLGEYMIYVDRVRKYTPLCGLNEAVRRAVNECIDEGVLEEFLRRNRSEVIKMSIYEYNRELHMQVIAEEEREEGKIEGKIDSLLMILHTKGEIPDELAVLIRGVKDEQILTRWTELALKTTSVEEFEETIKL